MWFVDCSYTMCMHQQTLSLIHFSEKGMQAKILQGVNKHCLVHFSDKGMRAYVDSTRSHTHTYISSRGSGRHVGMFKCSTRINKHWTLCKKACRPRFYKGSQTLPQCLQICTYTFPVREVADMHMWVCSSVRTSTSIQEKVTFNGDINTQCLDWFPVNRKIRGLLIVHIRCVCINKHKVTQSYTIESYTYLCWSQV